MLAIENCSVGLQTCSFRRADLEVYTTKIQISPFVEVLNRTRQLLSHSKGRAILFGPVPRARPWERGCPQPPQPLQVGMRHPQLNQKNRSAINFAKPDKNGRPRYVSGTEKWRDAALNIAA